MNRREFISSCGALPLFGSSELAHAAARRTKSLILVTADGMRWQELFTGIDKQLMNEKEAGMGNAGELRGRLWRSSPEERRAALMPFFWGTLAQQGAVLGNVNKGSSVRVTNRFHNSYPGYSELLTGRAQDDVIRGNNRVQNPTPSFLQFLKKRWDLPREQVAVFASWDMFSYICESKPGEIFINAGYQDSTVPAGSARVADLNSLQKQALYTEDSARHDAFTFALAMEYLKSVKPRLFYIAFDETDDWAHIKRYDRVLESIQFFDEALRQLWTWIQDSPQYRGSTTLMITCDHGRGSTKNDWNSHGIVPGDEQIWLAAIGPDIPARGELTDTPTYSQRDIAATALELLGVDYREFAGVKGIPITSIFAR
jgi:hypothetical protein